MWDPAVSVGGRGGVRREEGRGEGRDRAGSVGEEGLTSLSKLTSFCWQVCEIVRLSLFELRLDILRVIGPLSRILTRLGESEGLCLLQLENSELKLEGV